MLQSLDAVQLQADLWPSPFQLDESQQNALITASEADTLVQQMRHGAPDLCHGHALATLHAIAGHCITQLDRLGINQMAARTLYCLTALQFGPTFADQPNWEEALGRVAKKQISFMDALKELGM